MKKNLILILIYFFTSCSLFEGSEKSGDDVFGNKEYAEGIVAFVQPKWFKKNENFSLTDRQNKTSSHMLYDVDSNVDKSKRLVNFVVSTPAKSDFIYNIDLASGQHYLSKKMCSTLDEWNNYEDEIEKIPFSIGNVPRLLDQLGMPQKIIVFGSGNYIQKYYKHNSFDARVVAGYIEQICPRGGCVNNSDWRSRLVLVGVHQGNSRLSDVNTFNDLGKHYDLSFIKASLENYRGHNTVSNNYLPSVRMGAVVESGQALDFLDRNSIVLSKQKTNKLQRSCHKLYEKVWKDLGRQSEYEVAISKLNTKRLSTKDYLSELDRINKMDKNLFYKRFIRFYRKFGEDYKTCTRYVYSSNINKDIDKHWFFAYLNGVSFLTSMNYTFDCSRKVWIKNTVKSDGKRIIPKDKEFLGCYSREIDSAFSSVPSFMETLYQNSINSYMYVEYDKGAAGTHSKLYSWVKVDNKKIKCTDGSSIKSKYISFPSDVKWKSRALKDRMSKKVIF